MSIFLYVSCIAKLTMKDCNRVFRLPQKFGTCWMNSLLMSLFYSQGMRNILLSNMDIWETLLRKQPQSSDVFRNLNRLYGLIKDILINKFIEVPDRVVTDVAMNLMVPSTFIELLHKLDPKKFFYNDPHGGGWGFMYLRNLLGFLGVENVAFLDIYKPYENPMMYRARVSSDHMRHYSTTETPSRSSQFIEHESVNMSTMKRIYADYTNPKNNFEMLVLYQHHGFGDVPYEQRDKFVLTEFYLDKEIRFNGQIYVIDAVNLHNFNRDTCSKYHAIAGITCNNKRLIYNGWLSHTKDTAMGTSGPASFIPNINVPCPLFNYDWLQNGSFCLKPRDCRLHFVGQTELNTELCFNLVKHHAIYFAVRKDIYLKTLWYDKCANGICRNPINRIKCAEGKIINPKTGRCVKDPFFKAPPKKTVAKALKECPEGKVRNPNTGRCVKDPALKATKPVPAPKPVKECPEGKVRNPNTGRCIKDKIKLPAKKTKKQEQQDKKPCPEGKVRNPKTGRCIKDKK